MTRKGIPNPENLTIKNPTPNPKWAAEFLLEVWTWMQAQAEKKKLVEDLVAKELSKRPRHGRKKRLL
jgi:hypothetical protein